MILSIIMHYYYHYYLFTGKSKRSLLCMCLLVDNESGNKWNYIMFEKGRNCVAQKCDINECVLYHTHIVKKEGLCWRLLRW